MRFLVALLVVGSSLLPQARAGVVNYGNLAGTNVLFSNISESSSSIPVPALNLFGAPTVSGNSLVFSPTFFQVNQIGTGTKLVDSQLSFTLTATGGQQITGIQVSENGSYSLSTPGTIPNGQSVVNASATGFASTPSNTFSGMNAFSASSLSPNIASNVPWSLSFPINFAPTNSISFTLDNTLSAAANLAGTSASILKSGVRITVTTGNVPEPTSAAIFLALSFSGLAFYRRSSSVR